MASSPRRTLVSWNVNGIRAAAKKGFLEWLAACDADIVCLQETRALPEQLTEALRAPEGWHATWHLGHRKGYSGTAILSREKPLAITYGVGVPDLDNEGRTLTAHFPDLTVVNCYFPNGGNDHRRVPFKMRFYEAFQARVEGLRSAERPVLFGGDVNTAHHPIDLARPAQNKKTTGFLPEERAWMDRMVESGWIDTFRHVHGDVPERYSWWTMRNDCRARNVGWRIDYWFAAPELAERIEGAEIHDDVFGSDHCPVSVTVSAAG